MEVMSWLGPVLLGGVGALLALFTINPIRQLRADIEQAHEDRRYWSSEYWNAASPNTDPARWRQAYECLRRHASKLGAYPRKFVLGKWIWVRLGWWPSDKRMEEASRGFTLLSNSQALMGAGQELITLKAMLEAEKAIDSLLTKPPKKSKGKPPAGTN